MKYYQHIMSNLDAIYEKIDNKVTSGYVDNDYFNVAFPNYALRTTLGERFNVMGVLQHVDEQGKPNQNIYLCVDLIGGMGNSCIFFVNSNGRIYDEEIEKGLLVVCEILRYKFQREYGMIPGYPMFFSDNQGEFIDSLKNG